ncbi:MAG: hypothetical protein ABJA02_07320 [Acidobacteriota bacterium]
MDAYHKILVRIYEESGGKAEVDVDLTDVTKREGYFPSRDEICEMLKSESWVTETRPNIVQLTHWGIAEAKKAGSVRPDAARALERESKKLLAETRDFAVIIEEFIADPDDTRRKALVKKFSEIREIFDTLGGL